MYIYHALINTLSAHVIHINLNMIFYTHVEHSPTKTIHIKYYTKQKQKTHTHTHTHAHTHTHNDCSRNWVLILVRMEMLWMKEKQFFTKILDSGEISWYGQQIIWRREILKEKNGRLNDGSVYYTLTVEIVCVTEQGLGLGKWSSSLEIWR